MLIELTLTLDIAFPSPVSDLQVLASCVRRTMLFEISV